MKIWFVDDKIENQRTWLNSFPLEIRKKNGLQTFGSLEQLFSAFSSSAFPHILFIDFFIPPRYGIEVIEFFQNHPHDSPLLIAHSSLDQANDYMVQKGAHLKMAKRKGVVMTESICQKIQNQEDLEELLKQKDLKR